MIKGFHTAHAYFPEPGARPIRRRRRRRPSGGDPAHAERLLREAGFAAEQRIGTTTYKREWLPPDGSGAVWSYELWHARSHWRLDLHDGLNFYEVLKYVRTPQVPRFADSVRAGGVPLRVPDPNELIALLAAHASTELYSQRLLRLVELVLVVRRATTLGTLDWRAVESSLADRGWLRFAYPMLALTERLAPGTVDAPLLPRLLDRDHRARPRRHERSLPHCTDPRRELLAARAAHLGVRPRRHDAVAVAHDLATRGGEPEAPAADVSSPRDPAVVDRSSADRAPATTRTLIADPPHHAVQRLNRPALARARRAPARAPDRRRAACRPPRRARRPPRSASRSGRRSTTTSARAPTASDGGSMPMRRAADGADRVEQALVVDEGQLARHAQLAQQRAVRGEQRIAPEQHVDTGREQRRRRRYGRTGTGSSSGTTRRPRPRSRSS